MQSLSKYNQGNKYLLCAIDLFRKYAWVVPIKDKKGTRIVNAFKKIISERRKPNKIWADKGSEFYNSYFKDFLKINNIEMYSTDTEGKSVAAERFIRTLKNKIFKHITAISKNVYFDVLDDIVDNVRISKYKNIFDKGYAPNWSEKIFVVSKIKNAVPWTYFVSDLNGKKITGSFYNKELQKASQEKFRLEKVLKRKGDKLVKWKEYDNRMIKNTLNKIF